VLGGGSEPAPHVVMEYIEGTDLAAIISHRGALPVSEVVRIADGVADALGALQQAGIIHRDIKPANVMIDGHGLIKLTDFGIAKIVGIDTYGPTRCR
jgi:serine/threonine protein kinase